MLARAPVSAGPGRVPTCALGVRVSWRRPPPFLLTLSLVLLLSKSGVAAGGPQRPAPASPARRAGACGVGDTPGLPARGAAPPGLLGVVGVKKHDASLPVSLTGTLSAPGLGVGVGLVPGCWLRCCPGPGRLLTCFSATFLLGPWTSCHGERPPRVVEVPPGRNCQEEILNCSDLTLSFSLVLFGAFLL